jgi:hypothetical protein
LRIIDILKQSLIVTVVMMAGWGCRLAAKLTPPPPPSVGFLLKDEQIIGLRMTHPPTTSLHQFAKDSVAIAKRIMIDPQLFAIKMELKTNSLEPKSFAPAPSMAYATRENSVQYLELINTDQNVVFLELAPFIVPKRNCHGAQHVPPKYWRGPPLAEDEHPALLNWKIDLPEIQKIISDDADFADAKVLRFQITSVEWLRREDRRREKDCDWTMYSTEAKHSQRLLNQPGARAVVVIETERPYTLWPAPEYCFGNPFEGRYLIVNAAMGAELERGTYFYCEASEE